MYLIGLSGKKRSGKSTVADFIETLFPRGEVIQIAFADALKEEVARACGVTINYIENHKSNFRLILQGWGTDYRRKLNADDYWINKVLEKLVKIPAIVKLVVVTDVRFTNEADMIRKCGGFLFRIERPETDEVDYHASEVDLDKYKFDNIIVNDSGFTELELKVIDTLFINKLIPNKNLYSSKL